MTDETALTLQQVADRLGLAYSTIFAKRQQIGFRLPGSRVWRVWPSRLAELSAPRYNVTRLVLGDTGNGQEVRPHGRFAPVAVLGRGHILGTAGARKGNRHWLEWR